jgi:para-aminobenzoate synthetase component 1
VTDGAAPPIIVPLGEHDPATAFAPFARDVGSLLLLSGGRHPLARRSYAFVLARERHLWRHGDPGPVLPAAGSVPAPFGWAGLLGHELGAAFDRAPSPGLAGWPDAALFRHAVVMVFDPGDRTAALHARDEDAARTVLARLAGPATPVHPGGGGVSPCLPDAEVAAQVATVRDLIRAGDVFQVNISRRFAGALAQGDEPWSLFRRLTERSPAPFSAYLRLEGRAVVSHSPERFLTVAPDGRMETRPIKGTIRRGETPDQDRARAAALAASAKDRAENLMIVDLMRNDLARVARIGSVRVPSLCALETFPAVHHLVSTVEAKLRPGLGARDALAASFPPGSVTGAPKVRALEIIRDLEGEARGPYCGAMIRLGDDGELDSSVLIRTMACVEDEAGRWAVSFRAGGGITIASDPSAEVAEMDAKAAALRRAVEGCAAAAEDAA